MGFYWSLACNGIGGFATLNPPYFLFRFYFLLRVLTLCAMLYACLPAPVPTEGGAGRRHAIFYLCGGGSSRDELSQGEGVLNGKAINIIVEIDEDRFSIFFPAADFSGPLLQLQAGII